MTAFSRALVLALLSTAAGCKKSGPPAKGVPFADDFDRESLGPDYFPSGGQWTLNAGTVFSTGANNAPMFLNVALPADVVVELDVKSETPLVDSKIELMTDGRAHQSGYIFILGGWKNSISAIARLDEHGSDRRDRRPTGVTGHRWYRWRIEKKGGDIRWLIDGQPYLSFTDPAPLSGPGHDRFAFSNWQNEVRWDKLRIWAYADAPPATGTSTTTSK